jgi:hypothetical protein
VNGTKRKYRRRTTTERAIQTQPHVSCVEADQESFFCAFL